MSGNLIGYELEIKGLDEQSAKLRDYDQIADKEMTRAMNQSTLSLVAAIRPLTPIYRGRLRQSITSEVIHESVGSIVGKVGSNLKDEIYPAVMEFGRAKNKPVSAEGQKALERWGHLKLDVDGLGYVLARSITARGIKGKFFMKRGYEATKDKIVGYFEQARARIIAALEVK